MKLHALDLTSMVICLLSRGLAVDRGITAMLLVTSVFLKFNWYDKLEKN